MKFRPEMEVVRFRSEDVIAASGGLTNGSKMTFSNFGNGDITDNKITFDYRSPYQFGSNSTPADVISAIGANSDTKIWSEKSQNYYYMTDVFNNLINVKNDTSTGTWNYTYEYDSSANHFTRVS